MNVAELNTAREIKGNAPDMRKQEKGWLAPYICSGRKVKPIFRSALWFRMVHQNWFRNKYIQVATSEWLSPWEIESKYNMSEWKL